MFIAKKKHPKREIYFNYTQASKTIIAFNIAR